MAHPTTLHTENLIGNPMRTVIFKTENAVFQFDRKDVETRVEKLANEYGINEARTILKPISVPGDEPKTIQVKNNYFAYIVLDLIAAGKSSVTCEICGKMYEATQLRPISVGHGKSPFDVNPGTKGGIKSLFYKKKQTAMFGGKGYKCPAGHKLISMITWRT